MSGDELLIQGMVADDQEAFGTLFERYHALLFKTMLYKSGNHELASDLAQEAFLKVWLKRRRLMPKLAFFPLLAKIGHNLLQDHYKHMAVRARHEDHIRECSQKVVGDPERALARTQLQEKIAETVVTRLAERCREIFVLSRGGGLKNQEIADLLSISKKTVENQLHHALKVIRKRVRDYLQECCCFASY